MDTTLEVHEILTELDAVLRSTSASPILGRVLSLKLGPEAVPLWARLETEIPRAE